VVGVVLVVAAVVEVSAVVLLAPGNVVESMATTVVEVFGVAVDSPDPNSQNSTRLVPARRMASPAPTWSGRLGDMRG
jgi:hypothetical protein